MSPRPLRILALTASMLLCALGGLAIKLLWQGAGGRDFHLPAATMAALLFFVATAIRRWLRWSAWDFGYGLVVAVTLALLIISNFSGSDGLSVLAWFNLKWLGGVSLYLAPPWIIGFIGGSAWLRYSEKRNPSHRAQSL